MMMNQATMQATMVPVATSTFCSIISCGSSVTPLSTTLLCVKNIIHGAIVVPIMAMTSDTK